MKLFLWTDRVYHKVWDLVMVLLLEGVVVQVEQAVVLCRWLLLLGRRMVLVKEKFMLLHWMVMVLLLLRLLLLLQRQWREWRWLLLNNLDEFRLFFAAVLAAVVIQEELDTLVLGLHMFPERRLAVGRIFA